MPADEPLDWPLMQNNITRADLDAVIEFLQGEPILTQSTQVRAFEEEWSKWVGVRHSVFVNSGSSANLITLAALRELRGGGEVIVPTLTWVSDIAAVLHTGFRPVFVDIDRRSMGADPSAVLKKITPNTRAVFLTHILGYNALTRPLLDELSSRNIPLIEDVCESHGATFEGKRLGSFGWASNFSYYYAHHLSTIEGGMVCTNDAELYECARMLRSHGMVREASALPSGQAVQARYRQQHADLNPDFIFAFPSYNVRSTEINAVLGRSQLKRLDAANAARRENLRLFLKHLDPDRFQTDFLVEGSCNYAFTLVLRKPDDALSERLQAAMRKWKVEFRRGTSGGGNQLRQPYLRHLGEDPTRYPNVDHVHFYGFYIGNYPTLAKDKIVALCERLNRA